MKPQTRLLIIANNKNVKNNFELIERLERDIKTDLPTTIILDPNSEQDLIIKKHTLYDASIKSDVTDHSSEG